MDKKKLYEKLGAVWFQKVVFSVEKIKFKMCKKEKGGAECGKNKRSRF